MSTEDKDTGFNLEGFKLIEGIEIPSLQSTSPEKKEDSEDSNLAALFEENDNDITVTRNDVDFDEEDEDDFEEQDDVEEEEEDNSQQDAGEENAYDLSEFASYLVEEDIIEADFGDSVTEDDIKSAIKKEIEFGVESYKNSLPRELHEMVDFLEAGGRVEDYVNATSSTTDYSNIDLSKESVQKKIISDYLKSQDWPDDEIEEQIEDLELSDKLERNAKRFAKRLQDQQEKEKEQLVEQQRQYKQQQEQQYQEYLESLKTNIDKSDTLGNLPIKKKEKDAFYSYLTKPGRDGKTKYQKDLEKAPVDNTLALAFFMYKDFDIDQLEKRATTKVADKLERKLSRYSSGPTKSKQTPKKTKKNDFKNFRLF